MITAANRGTRCRHKNRPALEKIRHTAGEVGPGLLDLMAPLSADDRRTLARLLLNDTEAKGGVAVLERIAPKQSHRTR
jgi:hypothetical protein